MKGLGPIPALLGIPVGLSNSAKDHVEDLGEQGLMGHEGSGTFSQVVRRGSFDFR